MSSSRAQRLILAMYPERFRQRYGAELSTVAGDCGEGWGVLFDLLVGAVKAHLTETPSLVEPSSRRQRLLTTTVTVFATWPWSAAALALFGRAVNDGTAPGLSSWGWGAFAAGNVIFSLAAIGVIGVTLIYWLLVAVPAVRARDRERLQPALIAPAVVLLWLGGSGLLALATNHIQPGNYRHITAQGPQTVGGWVLLASYGLFTVACLVVSTLSARRALQKAELSVPLLTLSSIAAMGLAVALSATTLCAMVCVAHVMMVGGMSSNARLGAIVAVCGLLAASGAACTSSLRGLRAVGLRPGS